MPNDPSERLFELLLLGLTWIQELPRAPKTKLNGWSGSGVLTTLRAMDAIGQRQYKKAVTDPPEELRNYAFARTERHELSGRRDSSNRLVMPSMPVIEELMRASDMQLLAMISTPMYFGDMLFKPNGYRLFVTAKGVSRQADLTTKYRDVVSQARFVNEWRLHVRRMMAAHSPRPGGGKRRR
jgi:hypothetical protein